jgi:hypothetical protein
MQYSISTAIALIFKLPMVIDLCIVKYAIIEIINDLYSFDP